MSDYRRRGRREQRHAERTRERERVQRRRARCRDSGDAPRSPPPTRECLPCTFFVFGIGPHHGTVDWTPRARIVHPVDYVCRRKGSR